MTSRKEPEWFAQWLAERRAEEEDEHWNHYLAEEWESADQFISMCDPAGFADDVRSALMTAHEANEPWLRYEAPPLELVNKMRAANGMDPVHSLGTFWLKLKPRDAVLWLLSKPTYRHLVPAGLVRVVLRDANMNPDVTVMAVPTEKPKRRRGPKPNERYFRPAFEDSDSSIFRACRQTYRLAPNVPAMSFSCMARNSLMGFERMARSTRLRAAAVRPGRIGWRRLSDRLRSKKRSNPKSGASGCARRASTPQWTRR